MAATVIVYMTAQDRREAESIGRQLVGQRLAACVNILGPIRSIYRWQGRVHQAGETAFLAKTRAALVPRLVRQVRAQHGYECPCVVALPIRGGHGPFLQWIADETRPDARPRRPRPRARRVN